MRTLVAMIALTFVFAVPGMAQKVKRQANVITSEEIDAIRSETTDAYAIVQRLRPQYLRVRGMVEADPARRNEYHGPRVIVDGTPRGEMDALKQVSATAVKEIRYLSASDATTAYGTGYDGGAIVVLTH